MGAAADCTRPLWECLLQLAGSETAAQLWWGRDDFRAAVRAAGAIAPHAWPQHAASLSALPGDSGAARPHSADGWSPGAGLSAGSSAAAAGSATTSGGDEVRFYKGVGTRPGLQFDGQWTLQTVVAGGAASQSIDPATGVSVLQPFVGRRCTHVNGTPVDSQERKALLESVLEASVLRLRFAAPPQPTAHYAAPSPTPLTPTPAAPPAPAALSLPALPPQLAAGDRVRVLLDEVAVGTLFDASALLPPLNAKRRQYLGQQATVRKVTPPDVELEFADLYVSWFPGAAVVPEASAPPPAAAPASTAGPPSAAPAPPSSPVPPARSLSIPAPPQARPSPPPKAPRRQGREGPEVVIVKRRRTAETDKARVLKEAQERYPIPPAGRPYCRREWTEQDLLALKWDDSQPVQHLLMIDLDNCRNFFIEACAIEQRLSTYYILPHVHIMVGYGGGTVPDFHEWGHVTDRAAGMGRLRFCKAGRSADAAETLIMMQLVPLLKRLPPDSTLLTVVSGDADFDEMHQHCTDKGYSFTRINSFTGATESGMVSLDMQRPAIEQFFMQLRSRLNSTRATRVSGPDKELGPSAGGANGLFIDFTKQVSVQRQLKSARPHGAFHPHRMEPGTPGGRGVARR